MKHTNQFSCCVDAILIIYYHYQLKIQQNQQLKNIQRSK